MSTLNGIGTTMYGREYHDGGSCYIATKWFVIVHIPIIPLASYLILDENHKWFSSEYQLVKVSLNWKQVAKTYLFTIFVILIISLLLYFLI
jgi:hypothetical protein